MRDPACTRFHSLREGLYMDSRVQNMNITSVKGYKARGAHVGIKSKRRDLALIYSDVPASAAGVYTQNRIVAAPVILTRENLSDGKAQAIIVASGNANACTGEHGMESSRQIVKTVSEEMNVRKEDVIFAATGVIGVPFPTEKVVEGIRRNVRYLNRRKVSGTMVANAIMTTDTFQKEGFIRFKIGKKTVSMAGIANNHK